MKPPNPPQENPELDALLQKVSGGESGEKNPGEVQFFSRHRRELDNVEISEYDFRKPETLDQDELCEIRDLHENFARRFTDALSAELRTNIDIHVADVEQTRFGEFTASLNSPNYLHVIHTHAFRKRFCVEVSPALSFMVIERMLGGGREGVQQPYVPQRAMTQIEAQLIERFLINALNLLGELWFPSRTVEFEFAGIEHETDRLKSLPSTDAVFVIQLELSFGHHCGMMNLCLPAIEFEPVLHQQRHVTHEPIDEPMTGVQWEEAIASRLSKAKVELTGVLAETTITLAELRNLETGDVILTEKQTESPAVLNVEGKHMFHAHLGQRHTRRALKIAEENK